MPEHEDSKTLAADIVSQSDLDIVGSPGGTTLRDRHPSPRYELLEEIARGGMGAVYVADRPDARPRKSPSRSSRPAYKPGSAVARRFVDEARIAGQLQHPGIPPIHDLGTLPDGRPFLAMKLIKGRTLDDLLAERPDPSADRGRFLAAFEQVCQAVAYAHARRVIHRDLKPPNIMVGAFGEVQVMDWGLAKVLGRGDGTNRDRPTPTNELGHRDPLGPRRCGRLGDAGRQRAGHAGLHGPRAGRRRRSSRSTSGATSSAWARSWR